MEPSKPHLTTMILAGGLGTRLRPVVSDRPKPLAMVGNVPFLEILIDSLAAKGLRDFVMLIGYKGGLIADHLGYRYQGKLNIAFSHEKEPLGTGGAVRHAAPFASDPTLLVNGDTFFDADPWKLLRFHVDKKARVTLSLVEVADATRYGSVLMDRDGKITGFREKDESSSGPGLVNAGLSLLSRDFILDLTDRGPFSMERDIFPSLAKKGAMFGLVQNAAFFDIGTPESYDEFTRFIKSRRLDG